MMTFEVFSGGPFAENSYLAVGADGVSAVVIDPGAEAEAMVARIRERGLSLVAILLTHAHLDHVEGVATVRSEIPDAPIHLHPADRRLYDMVAAQAAAFGVRVDAPPPPDVDLLPGQSFEFGGTTLQVRHTPGHAPGHVILWDEEAGVAFVGDVVFAGSIGRTDLPGGDFRVLMQSIRDHILTLPDETRLLTGHGPETTVRHERVGNPFLVPHYGGDLA
jgi:glyoxylase-like metal-dependent hydrolase (beta-lactamase superfamily II)